MKGQYVARHIVLIVILYDKRFVKLDIVVKSLQQIHVGYELVVGVVVVLGLKVVRKVQDVLVEAVRRVHIRLVVHHLVVVIHQVAVQAHQAAAQVHRAVVQVHRVVVQARQVVVQAHQVVVQVHLEVVEEDVL